MLLKPMTLPPFRTPKPSFTKEKGSINMKTFFKTEENLGIDEQRMNGERTGHFEELMQYGSVSVEGIATRSINLHTENIGLSMECAVGLASSKVGKRKPRVSRKLPIKVFSADATNFMAMVHKLTGFQSPAHLLPGSHQTSLLKPLAARPLHPFMKGVYVPDSPAGDKMTANFLDNSLSCALSQIKSSLNGRQQFDSTNNVSLATKEVFNTLHSSTSANRFTPPIHNPAFEALHSQEQQHFE